MNKIDSVQHKHIMVKPGGRRPELQPKPALGPIIFLRKKKKGAFLDDAHKQRNKDKLLLHGQGSFLIRRI